MFIKNSLPHNYRKNTRARSVRIVQTMPVISSCLNISVSGMEH